MRREKLEEDKEHGQQFNYRLIFRTSEVSLVCTFWGAHVAVRGPARTFYVLGPCLNLHLCCLQ